MKDQYIGDINDFHKYALLRSLGRVRDNGVHVCWMRTPPDERSDGARVAYLEDPSRFRPLDPQLFDALKGLVSNEDRSVAGVERSGLLPAACFHPEFLADDRERRERYFEDLRATLEPGEIIFFDPDNGLQVASVPKGARRSSKYLYWDELSSALGEGRTACIYQHFPRRPRAAFLADLLGRLEELADEHFAFAVTSPWVAYLICAPRPVDDLIEAAARVAARPEARLELTLPRGSVATPQSG